MRIKVLVSMVMIIMTTKSYTQNLNIYFVRENVQTLFKNSELILSDPLIMDNYNDIQPIFEASGGTKGDDEDISTPLFDFGLNAETTISPTSKHIRLPIRFRLGNASLSATIPFYFDRSMNYSHGKVSTSGFGDVIVKANYKIVKSNLYNELMINAKLPTGDANKQVEGYLVPLGTGSTDFLAGNIFILNLQRFTLYNNTSYKLSGSYNRIVEVYYPDFEGFEQTQYNITNGNTLMLNTNLSYKTGLGLRIIAGSGFITNSEGKVDRSIVYSWDNPETKFYDESALQDFTYFDLSTGLGYTILGFDMQLVLNIPVYTKRNISNIESDRTISAYAKLSRKLF